MDSSRRYIAPEEYPAEVKRCIEEMQQQSKHIQNDLVSIQRYKEQLEHEITEVTSRLHKLAHDQASKRKYQLELDRTIFETEKIYTELLERQRLHELPLQSSKCTELPPVKNLQDTNPSKSQLPPEHEPIEPLGTAAMATKTRKQKKEVTFKDLQDENERAGNNDSEFDS